MFQPWQSAVRLVDASGKGTTEWQRWQQQFVSPAVPVSHTDPGTEGQTAIDSAGNFYFCYTTNRWARIGPAGYSNTF